MVAAPDENFTPDGWSRDRGCPPAARGGPAARDPGPGSGAGLDGHHPGRHPPAEHLRRVPTRGRAGVRRRRAGHRPHIPAVLARIQGGGRADPADEDRLDLARLQPAREGRLPGPAQQRAGQQPDGGRAARPAARGGQHAGGRARRPDLGYRPERAVQRRGYAAGLPGGRDRHLLRRGHASGPARRPAAGWPGCARSPRSRITSSPRTRTWTCPPSPTPA